ncbi:M15 family metallopeptidase [bacterium]|nr:M15 family metallopeptidase [bacterium]
MAEKYQFLSSGSRNIVGEPFDPYVAYQVKQRQETQFSGYNGQRGDSDIQILNNQNAWVKMASGVSISGSLGNQRLKLLGLPEQDINSLNGTQLAESAILFNTLSSIDPIKGTSAASGATTSITMREGITKTNKLWNLGKSYGLGGTDFGILPSPGIQDVTITCLNRGSIRKATINLKAYNKFQFAIIEMLYLQLGKHILLEWGNDKYIDNDGNYQIMGNTLIEDKWFNQSGINQLEMLEYINIYRSKYSANYDGFFGKVSNFSWDFGNDSTYNIKVDLVTIGDVIESLKVNNQMPLYTNQDIKQGEQKINTSAETTLLNERIKTILSGWLIAAMGEADINESDRNPNYFILANKDKESENGKIIEKYRYFVTLSEFLDLVEELCIPIILSGGETKGSYKLVEFIQPECVSYSLNQISLDPRICLLKPKFSKSLKNKIYYPNYLEPLYDYVQEEKGVIYGNLSNLYLNYDFIFKCLDQNTNKEGNLSLFKLLNNLCDGINNALGNSVNLEPIIRNDRYITIIDQNPIANIENLFPESKETAVPLEVYGYNPTSNQSNFVNNITFQTSITPELSSTISIGATAAGSTVSGIEGTAFEKWSIGLKDRFLEKIEERATTVPSGSNELSRNISKDEKRKKMKEFEAKWYANQGFFSTFSFTGKKYFSDDTVSTGWYRKEEYKYKAFKKYKEDLNKKVDEQSLKREFASNFILYLGYCFGNNQLQFPDNEGKAIIIPYNSPDLSNYLKFDGSFISKGKEVYKKYLSTFNIEAQKASLKEEKLNKVVASNQIGFIPVNFDLNLKGISGFKIYQKIEINQKFLPTQYPEALEFLVTKVDHIIRDNHWTTGLTTLSIPRVNTPILDESEVSNTFIIDDPDLEVSTEYITPESNLPIKYIWANNVNNIRRISKNELLTSAEIGLNRSIRNVWDNFFTGLEENPKLKGHTIFIRSAYRSFREQKLLYKENPNNAKEGRSRHNYGAAIDIVIAPPTQTGDYVNPGLVKKVKDVSITGDWMVKNRRKNLWENSGVVDIANKNQLLWGDFTNYKDWIHFYYPHSTKVAKSKALEINPDLSFVRGYLIDIAL